MGFGKVANKLMLDLAEPMLGGLDLMEDEGDVCGDNGEVLVASSGKGWVEEAKA